MEWAVFGDRGEEGLHWTWPGERLDTQGRGPQHKDCIRSFGRFLGNHGAGQREPGMTEQ